MQGLLFTSPQGYMYVYSGRHPPPFFDKKIKTGRNRREGWRKKEEKEEKREKERKRETASK